MEDSLYTYQLLSIIGSLSILLFLVELVRKRKLKENYSLLWFGITIIFLIFSIWPDFLFDIASLLDIQYAPSALFLILVTGLYLLLIHFSVVVSGLSEKNKRLSQKLGLMDLEIKKLKKALKKGHRKKT